MILKKRIEDIRSFIMPYENIWQHEILNYYPQNIDFLNSDILNSTKDFDQLALWKLDCGIIDPPSNNNYLINNLYKEISQLSKNEDLFSNEIVYPKEDQKFFQIKAKKRHEIKRILPFIKNIKQDMNIDSIFDFGGGIGHLAHFLSNELSTNVYTIDKDPILQKTGSNKYNKSVSFLNYDYTQTVSEFDKLITPNSLLLGLHSCGNLSNKILNIALKQKVNCVITLGCCYLKLNDVDLNLSQYMKKHPIYFSRPALSLATRSHESITFDDFKLKERVKSYRYSLHFLLHNHFNISKFEGVGDERPWVYKKDFAFYALKKINDLFLKCDISEKFLLEFYSNDKIKNLVRKMFKANIIRWRFSRLIELMILLDRALILQENGYDSKLVEIFDGLISPRNIAVTGCRRP